MSLLYRIIFVLILVSSAMSCNVCSYLACPAADLTNDNTTTSSNDSYGSATSSGDHQLNSSGNYMLELSTGLYVPGDRLTVKLLLTRCIEYDQNVLIGLSWYKIEVIYEQTGLQAPGEFSKLDPLSEASICEQNTIVFKTCRPSVLDLPAKYHWTPSQDSRGPICFKATVHHNLANSCEVITNCIPGNHSNTVTASPTIPPTLKIIIGTLPTEPSPDHIKHCEQKWHCNNSRRRDFCGSNGVTYPSRCHWRRDKCIYKEDITITRGACPPVVTPSPSVVIPSTTVVTPSTTVPTPTPVPVCENLRKKIIERINNSKDDWLPQCSCTGQMKPVQCWRHHGILECWCSTADGSQISGTERNITKCHSPTVYDLGCF